MSGSKRQRELARSKYERQQARRSAEATRRARRQRIVAIVVVVALVLGGVSWALIEWANGNADSTATEATASSSAATPSAAATTGATAAPSAAATSTATSTTEAAPLNCTEPAALRTSTMTFSAAPTTGTGASLTLATNCGDIVIALDPKAPKTVASEVFLAGKGFYDGTTCHRLTTSGIYVLQCGDPKGDGTGGPGYTVPDENLPTGTGVNYPAGTVAMANAGPNTGGSQFFIVYDDTTLPASYTVFGQVTSGLDIVKEIASVGTADGSGDGAPKQPVVITKATVQAQ